MKQGIYYNRGGMLGGECGWSVININNPSMHEMRCIGSDEE